MEVNVRLYTHTALAYMEMWYCPLSTWHKMAEEGTYQHVSSYLEVFVELRQALFSHVPHSTATKQYLPRKFRQCALPIVEVACIHGEPLLQLLVHVMELIEPAEHRVPAAIAQCNVNHICLWIIRIAVTVPKGVR